ncbi:hypothetical protein [Sphingomonas endolithica]|uniref:hypothetical protein n=1 Tax=Sphingomonas endolithica TaxID=2972485 RepID=UPI0021AF1E56|nr:hypothetical protein [Sphingomonas sp. ZFBP2030]
MADTTHSTTASRRAILGAAFAAPALISLGASPAIATSMSKSVPWDAAMKRYIALKLRQDTAWAHYKALPSLQQKGAADDEMDRITNEFVAAQDLLLEMPAPHNQALLWKLEHVLEIEGDGFTASWGGPFIKQVMDDMRRLLAAGA